MPPGRPRRRFFNRKSAALAAVITCAAGFYAGIRVEKGQLASTAPPRPQRRRARPQARRPGGAGGASRRIRGPASAPALGGGRRHRNASFGTISSVNGNTIYLTDPTGNTVKVTLSSSTKLTKSLSVSKSSLHPGDTIVDPGREELQRHARRDLGQRPGARAPRAARAARHHRRLIDTPRKDLT